MDSYVELCRAPYLPLPPPGALIREEESPPLTVREVEEGAGNRHTFQKA